MLQYSTDDYECQVQRITNKLRRAKGYNQSVIDWLTSQGLQDIAAQIEGCGTHVGITDIGGVARVVKADFCRQRLCAVCAWRRQARFLAQMYPVIGLLDKQGYRLIFVTLTVKNMGLDDLPAAIDNIMHAYDRLLKRRKIKRAWRGVCRSVELTYNQDDDTFHPHVHMLVAVRPEYFMEPDLYISKTELWQIWRDCLGVDYDPDVSIQTTTDTARAGVETLKYALKPTQAAKAYQAYYYMLKHRRLISFSGVFADLRKQLRYSDFDSILTDTDDLPTGQIITYQLYTWDATGGYYQFTQTFEMEV